MTNAQNPVSPDPAPATPPNPAPAAEAAPPKRMARWKKVLIWTGSIAGGLVLLVLILVPLIVPGIIKSQIREQVAANLDATAEVDSASFSWGGAVKLGGVRIKDLQGRPVASVKNVDVDVSLFSAIGGTYLADVKVEDPELRVWKLDDGRLNLEALMKTAPPPSKPGPSTGPAPTSAPREKKAPPTVKSKVRVSGGRLVITGPGGETIVRDLTVSADVDTLEKPVAFSATAAIDGGRLEAKGEALVADPDKAKASMKVTVDALALDKLKPAAALFTDLTDLGGRVDVALDVSYAAPSDLRATGSLKVADFLAAGPAVGPEPVRLPSVVVTPDVTFDGSGTGKQTVRFDAGGFLQATLEGTSQTLLTDGSFDGNLSLFCDFAGASESLASLLQLKEGYRLGGRLTLEGKLKATTGAGRFKTGSADLTAKVADLAPTDASGRAIDLGADRNLGIELSAAIDAPAETAVLHHLKVTGGSVNMDAQGGVAKETLKDTTVNVDADLDGLAARLAAFMDLPLQFGGRVKVASVVRGEGDAAVAKSTIDVTALRLKKDDFAFGPIDMTVRQEGTIDLRGGGAASLKTFQVRSAAFDIDASGEGSDILDPARTKGSFTYRATVRPKAATDSLGSLTQGYALSGEPVVVEGRLTFDPAALDAGGRAAIPALNVTGPALKAARVVGGVATFDASVNLKTMDVTLRDLAVTSPTLAASMEAGDVQVSGLTLKASGRVGTNVAAAKASLLAQEIAAPGKLRTPIRGVNVKLDATMEGDDVEIPTLEIESSVARGGGRGRITSLMKEGMAGEGRFLFSGEFASALALVEGFEQAKAGGSWSVNLELTPATGGFGATLKAETKGLSISGYEVAGKPLEVKDADVTAEATATVDDKTTIVNSFRVVGPGLLVKGGGSAGYEKEFWTRAAVELALEPDELTKRAAAFLAGYELHGRTVAGTAEVSIAENRYGSKGKLLAPEITLAMPEGKAVTQKDLNVEFDFTADLTPRAERVDIRKADLVSTTARASLSGTITGLEKMSADVSGSASADLEKVMADLGGLLPSKDLAMKGKAAAKFKAEGDAGQVTLTLDATVENFEQTAGGVKVADPKIAVATKVDVVTERMDLDIKDCTIHSQIARGKVWGQVRNASTAPEFKDLKGDLTYVPAKLGVLLKPYLFGGELKGDTEQNAAFTLNGRASEMEPMAILRALNGDANVGLGLFTMTGLNASGNVGLVFDKGIVKTDSGLAVNTGTIKVKGGADLRPPEAKPSSTFEIAASEVRLNSGMAPLLMMLHPLFAKTKDTAGQIDGFVSSGLTMTYAAPLTMETLTGGWTALPKKPLNGHGRIDFRDLGIVQSALLGEILEALGKSGASKEIRIRPIEFTIVNGRLNYLKPWQWTLAGAETHFAGSIGLDPESKDCLDLRWIVPVSEEMVEKVPALKASRGKTIEVPITGTMYSPRFGWKQMIDQLIKNAAEEAVKDKLEDLFGKDEKRAKELLKEADDLYAQGKKKDAAERYARIKDKYDKTKVYKDNKDRIKQRMTEQ